MRQISTALLSIAALCAFAWTTPAAALGGDKNAARQQAQLHPWEANQAPEWSPYGVAMGEVYGPAYAYGQPIYGYSVMVPAPLAQCHLAQDWTGQLITICP